MTKYVKPTLSVLIFLLMQIVGTIFAIFYTAISESGMSASAVMEEGKMPSPSHFSIQAIILALIIANVLTFLLLYATNFVDRKNVFQLPRVSCKWSGIAVSGAFCGMFATGMLNEWFELPNLLESQFCEMSRSVLGIISLTILGPVVEELVFREAIIGNLLKEKLNPWIAIVISSLSFALVHGNPAQIPFAAMMGIILGIVYCKTGNIALSSVIHILNNSIAVIEMNVLGEKVAEFSYRDLFGYADIPIILLLAISCFVILRRFWTS